MDSRAVSIQDFGAAPRMHKDLSQQMFLRDALDKDRSSSQKLNFMPKFKNYTSITKF